MKKCLFVLSVLAIFFMCFTVVPAMAIPTASLNVLDSHIMVDESFDVEVWVDGDSIGVELLAFGFDVDPMSTLSFISYDGSTIESSFDDDSFGSNNVAGSTFPGIVDNNVLLATLSFTAGNIAGSDTLDILGLFNDFLGLYYTDGTNYNIEASLGITVNDAPPVPEPATLFLLGTGLIGMIGLKKKKEEG